MRVAVLGATGTVGRALVPLLARSHDVVAVARHPTPVTNGVRTVAADVTDAEALRPALEGMDVVYYLVHSLGEARFDERDRTAASTAAREAERAGVRQIVYLGGLGEESPDLSPHLRSRAETAQVLASGSVPVTTLRAAMVIGAGSAAFETIVALVDRLPGMICPRWVSTPTQPIALQDIAAYLAAAAGREEMFGQAFDAGGPDVMTYREMIERIARIRGRRPLIVEVPVLTPRLSSYWLTLVTPVRSRVARPLVEGLRTPTVAHDERLRDLVPLRLTVFDEAARTALGARDEDPRERRAR
ncbi:MAG TPA: NAD(P)H-binding protein [Gaiella sp.]|nr:NAD(P)H-binding protein [Gaiella sp.]